MKKTPSQSEVLMTELVLPNDANLLGNLLGGRLLHLVDIAGALAASRHAHRPVATASIESVDFCCPIKLGSLVRLHARLIWVGRTSMQTIVKVEAEDLITGKVIATNTAYLTFVALDDNNCPTPVPGLEPETDEERELFRQAEARRKSRSCGVKPESAAEK